MPSTPEIVKAADLAVGDWIVIPSNKPLRVTSMLFVTGQIYSLNRQQDASQDLVFIELWRPGRDFRRTVTTDVAPSHLVTRIRAAADNPSDKELAEATTAMSVIEAEFADVEAKRQELLRKFIEVSTKVEELAGKYIPESQEDKNFELTRADIALASYAQLKVRFEPDVSVKDTVEATESK